MIGITLASSDPIYSELAEEARKRFMKYTGLNCHVVYTQHPKNYSAKLQLWKTFTQTEQSFCYFDCDNWLVRECDLTQFDKKKEFIAVTDSLGHKLNPSNWSESFTHKDAVRYNIPFDKMINGGFWIANARNHSYIFEIAMQYLRDPKLKFDDFGEQNALSKALFDSRKDTVLKLLPVEYNCMVGGGTEREEVCDNPYFIHAAGMEGKYKKDHLEWQEGQLNK